MVTRCTSWAYVAAVLLLTLVSTATAKYSGGTGEPNDPYQIATAADLIALSEAPEDYDKHFLLTADIDLDPNLPARKVFDRAVVAPDTNDTESWYQGTPFTGVLDGRGHTISRLTINGATCLGLFGELEYPAEVKNLGVVDVNIAGSDYYVGGLAGSNEGGAVTCCYSTGAVSGSGAGGLVGNNGEGNMTDCYSTTAVSGSGVGGLVWNNDGVVTQCYSTGTVNGSGGGLVGTGELNYTWYGVVNNSFWDTQTSGQASSAVGGTGLTTAQMQDANTFMAAGWDFVGPADGPHDIWSEPPRGGYPILSWQLSPLPRLPTFSGGTGEANDPYLLATQDDVNHIGHNPRLMGCHFRVVADLDLAGLPDYPIGEYPYRYAGVFDGNGKAIRNLSYTFFGCVGGVVRDLRLVDPNCIGEPVVSNYGAISRCSIEGGRVLGDGGLVGFSIGSVTDCRSAAAVSGGAYGVGGLVGINYGSVIRCRSMGAVNGARQLVGGLVGDNWGTVSQCYSTGTVSGNNCVGGLLGDSYYGDVTGCYSTGSVMGSTSVGGLAGGNFYGRVANCYSTAAVSGEEGVGGLVGVDWGTSCQYETISNCYATGVVAGDTHVGGLVGTSDCPGDTTCGAHVTNSFWDIETSGQTASAAGEGKTTAEMQTAKTFIEAGWDFVGETINGTEDIWWILEGKDYPRLWWEQGDEASP